MQSSCGSGALCLLYICAMKCMKYSNGGGIDRPKRRGKGSSLPASSSINFGSDSNGSSPSSPTCKPGYRPATAVSGSHITAGRAVSSNGHKPSEVGSIGNKKQLDRSRVISAKEMARKKERDQKKNMRAMRRSGKPQSNPRTLGTTSSFN